MTMVNRRLDLFSSKTVNEQCSVKDELYGENGENPVLLHRINERLQIGRPSYTSVVGFPPGFLPSDRPPLFNGTNYIYWKARMRIFIQANNYDMWRVIENGPTTPVKVVDGARVPKEAGELDVDDKRHIQISAKAMNVLYCALDANVFILVFTCLTAKEIWDRLEVIYEGTTKLKKSKIDLLVHKYELFKMKQKESIIEMFTRFTHILNSLKSLGKSYTNCDLVYKILRSLPKNCEWKAIVTVIKEVKDLTTLSVDELLASLMIHELDMKNLKKEEDKKRKSIALKPSTNEDEDSEDDDPLSVDELAMFSRFYNKFSSKKNNFGKRFPKRNMSKGETSKEDEVICFVCLKPGHIKVNCPYFKKSSRRFKKEVKWSNSSSDEEASDQKVAIPLSNGKGR